MQMQSRFNQASISRLALSLQCPAAIQTAQEEDNDHKLSIEDTKSIVHSAMCCENYVALYRVYAGRTVKTWLPKTLAREELLAINEANVRATPDNFVHRAWLAVNEHPTEEQLQDLLNEDE